MYKYINITNHNDERGYLYPLEVSHDIPYPIERIFYIKNATHERGNHAHTVGYETLIPIQGSFKLYLTDGCNETIILCDDDCIGVLINPNIWLKLFEFSKDCIILALCSHKYKDDSNIDSLVVPEKTIQFLDLNHQHAPLHGEISCAINKLIRENDFILGKSLQDYEYAFASYNNVRYCTAICNGTVSLLCALKSLQLNDDDEVLIQSNAFIAAPLAIEFSRLKFKLVDIDDNLCMDLNDLENQITKNTKCIIVVHLYGNCPDMERLIDIKNRHNIPLIEDTAQAHGSTYKHKKLGTWGDIGCFSFYPSKNLGAMGDGGCIVTNNEYIYKYITKYRNYGGLKKYTHELYGMNFRMSNIQAVVLSIKLPYLDQWNMQRFVLADKYNELLSNVKQITTLKHLPHTFQAYHLYVIKVNNRDNLQQFLHNKNIQTAIHYPQPFYKTEAFKEYNNIETKADLYCNKLLSLPLYPGMDVKDIQFVCNEIIIFFDTQNNHDLPH